MIGLLLAIIYAAFISLGLPDGLLGSAWPTIYQEFGVPVSYMGIVSMIISGGTVISSLKSDYLTKKLGVGLVTAISVFLTAFAIFGFSISHNFILICLFAIPYGLGAGSVDAALNNYVALHYKSRHMSWLHCMWGVGASLGPVIMGFALNGGKTWNRGYFYVGIIQVVLTAILFCSIPLWKKNPTSQSQTTSQEKSSLRIKDVLAIPGAKAALVTFFCYCALEQTAGQWAASFLVLARNVSPELAARFASFFYIGITVGRGICGFITFKLNDKQMVRLGLFIILIGVILIFLPNQNLSLAGLIIIGLGCAPVYPSMIHSTPLRFGADKSQAVIGMQMATAYIGTTLMPPIYGLFANFVNANILPFYLGAILILMFVMHEICEKKVQG